MGKIDDMRRQREAQHRAPTTRVAPAAAPPPVTPAQAASAESPAAADEDPPALDLDATSGVCSACRKVKPMQRGLIASHQKGLGKMCTGSRKPPA